MIKFKHLLSLWRAVAAVLYVRMQGYQTLATCICALPTIKSLPPPPYPLCSFPAVFTTSQKKTMIKWLEKLNGQEAAADADAAAPTKWTLLDVTDSTAEVMDEEGETQQVQLSVCDAELVDQLRRLFESEAEVVVELGTRHGTTAITHMVQ